MSSPVQRYKYLVALVLCRVPQLPDHDFAVGMVGSSDEFEESIVTPFPDGIMAVFEATNVEPAFEEFWNAVLIGRHFTERDIVDGYFESINKDQEFFFSEPFVVDEVSLTDLVDKTDASLSEKGYRITTQYRFEELLKG